MRAIVANMWTGAATVRRLAPGDPDPTVEELDEIATALTGANDGVKPVVRVLEAATWRAGSAA